MIARETYHSIDCTCSGCTPRSPADASLRWRRILAGIALGILIAAALATASGASPLAVIGQ